MQLLDTHTLMQTIDTQAVYGLGHCAYGFVFLALIMYHNIATLEVSYHAYPGFFAIIFYPEFVHILLLFEPQEKREMQRFRSPFFVFSQSVTFFDEISR